MKNTKRYFHRVRSREELNRNHSGSVIYYRNKELFPEERGEYFEISIPYRDGGIYNQGRALLQYGRRINQLEHCERLDRLNECHPAPENPNYRIMPCFEVNGHVWDIPRIRVVGEPNEEEARILADMIERMHIPQKTRNLIGRIEENDRRREEKCQKINS